jgi:membrane protein
MKYIKKYIKRLHKITVKNEMRVLPGQIAFFIVLSLIPLVTLLGFIASQFQVDMKFVLDVIKDSLPNQVIEILLPALENPGFLTGLSMTIGFFLASNATNSIIVASNMLFKIEDNGYIRRRIKAIIMLIILVFLFLFMLIVIAFGNDIASFVLQLIFKNKVPYAIYEIFLFIKWTLGLLFAYVMVKMIFTIAPDSPIPSKNMNKGALFTTLAWIIITSIYSIYVTNFADYNIFYGSLSNIVILMMWVYFLSYTLVVGMAINSDDYLKKDS